MYVLVYRDGEHVRTAGAATKRVLARWRERMGIAHPWRLYDCSRHGGWCDGSAAGVWEALPASRPTQVDLVVYGEDA